MGIKVHVIFYSMYGHVYRMAEAVLAGVKEVAGAEASLLQVAELVPDAILEKSGAKGRARRLRTFQSRQWTRLRSRKR